MVFRKSQQKKIIENKNVLKALIFFFLKIYTSLGIISDLLEFLPTPLLIFALI
jgi:hypothetical protein